MNNDIPKIFDSKYYDSKYFADKIGKSFCRSEGYIDNWGYRNPEGEWLGCRPIVDAWKLIFNPKNMLDVGCGRGTFIAYAQDIGIKAEGFDFSEWAINNLYSKCKKEWVKIHDVTKPWPYPDKHFDLVTILDLMEHVYIDDIDFVINDIYRVANKWVFLQIATVKQGSHEKGYIIKKGESVPVDLQVYTVAGHVLVQTEKFWVDKLKRDGWIIRKDLVEQFCKIVPEDVIRNWILNTLIIVEKIE